MSPRKPTTWFWVLSLTRIYETRRFEMELFCLFLPYELCLFGWVVVRRRYSRETVPPVCRRFSSL